MHSGMFPITYLQLILITTVINCGLEIFLINHVGLSLMVLVCIYT